MLTVLQIVTEHPFELQQEVEVPGLAMMIRESSSKGRVLDPSEDERQVSCVQHPRPRPPA